MNKYINLFLTFLKIGAFTFGGGTAMIPLLKEEFVDKKQWIDNEEFKNIIVISESTPGPIAINSATFIGYKTAGVLGALLSTLAVCLPSFIIIFIFSLFLDDLLKYEIINNAFTGIKIGVCVLIGKAAYSLFKIMNKSIWSLSIFFISFIVLLVINLLSINFSSIFIILIGLLIGLIYTKITSMKEGVK